jgi:hypothetical protein
VVVSPVGDSLVCARDGASARGGAGARGGADYDAQRSGKTLKMSTHHVPRGRENSAVKLRYCFFFLSKKRCRVEGDRNLYRSNLLDIGKS